MAVYVDETFDYGRKGKWCHLMTDSEDINDLHYFAKSIGLKRNWFQNHNIHPHYDLSPLKREMAIKEGAIPVTRQEAVKLCSKLFR